MTEAGHHRVPEAPEPSGDPSIDEVKADIAATRAELQDTVDALAEKLDVKAQAGKKVDAAKEKVTDTADNVAQQVRDKTPEPVQNAVAAASPYRNQIAVGALVAAVVAVVLWRRRR